MRGDYDRAAQYLTEALTLSRGAEDRVEEARALIGLAKAADEPQYIDYPKYARVVNLVMDVGQAVANLDQRVAVDKPKPPLGAQCVQ